MYLVEERRKLILEEIISAGTVYVSDLAKKYEVTYETIRKDLTHLEKKGLLVKSHGGATLKQGAVEHPFQVREKKTVPSNKLSPEKRWTLSPPTAQ